ncbi:MAG: hypothetical protein QM710_10100 [Flavobacterium sp.]
MKWHWKLLIGLGLLTVLAVILNVGLNIWIQHQLPKIINKKNDSAYFITYKKLRISLWHSNMNAEEIVIIPKAGIKDSINKAGIYGTVKSIEVRDFKVWSFLFSDRLKAKSITVEKPEAVLYKRNEKTTIRESVVAPFEKIITVSDVFINHGDFKIMDVKSNKTVLSLQNIGFNLDGIVVTDAILKEKIPFKFNSYTLSCDSLYYRPDEFYHIQVKKIKSAKNALALSGFEMVPEYSRHEFVAKINKEKDLYTLFCDSIKTKESGLGL